jgi:hypothetical protein
MSKGGEWGLPADLCVMSIEELTRRETLKLKFERFEPSGEDFKQFENGICTFKHCRRPMDEHERDVGFGVWDCPKPAVTPPERPRGKEK